MLRHALARCGSRVGMCAARRPAPGLAPVHLQLQRPATALHTFTRASTSPAARALRPAVRTLALRAAASPAPAPALARAARRLLSGAPAAEAAAAAADLPWYKSAQGLMILGNVTYLLQLGGFLMTDQLAMRSFLVGGSGVFVVYALLQPTRLLIPAAWEFTFASIHACMIYKLLATPSVSLTKEELRLYGMVFQRHDLEIEEFRQLAAVGSFETLPDKHRLTTAGEAVDKVYVVVRGSVAAETEGGAVAIPPGHYVGEVSFIQSYTDAKKLGPGETAPTHVASTTCTAVGETQVFVWKQDDLRKYLADDHDGATAKIIRTIFSDVLEKFHIGQ